METIYNPSSLHFEALKTLVTRMQAVVTEEEASSGELLNVLKEWMEKPTRIDQGRLSPYPKSSEYDAAMKEAERAIHGLYQHVKSLDAMVNRSKEDQKTEYERLYGLLNRLNNLYADVESLVFGKNRMRTSSEFFLSDENIDYSRIGGKALRVEGGTVSLPYGSEPIVLNQSVTASIIPGVLKSGIPLLGTESNGFAGNNHEVRVIASDIASGVDQVGRVSFIGEEDRNADLSAVLDQDATSWFEYEKIDMRETEQQLIAQKKNLSYEIAPGKVVDYIGKPDDGLKLHVLLTLKEKTVVNELEVVSYIPPNYGASEASIEDILVSDGVNPPTSVFDRKPLEGERIFRFPPREAKSIQIKFKQVRPYPFDYGHVFYEQLVPAKGQSVFFDKQAGRMRAKNPKRLEGPLQEVSDMGYVVVEEKTGISVSYGEQSYAESRAIGVKDTLQKATGQIDPTKVQMGVEKIEALRYAIGIRDIIVREATYETEGELVTKPHYYDEPVERITLETDAVMEEDARSQGANVLYYVSVDDGAEWLPIAPVNSNQDISIPRLYRVGQTEESTNMPVIETTAPIYSLRFKVVMTMDSVRTQALGDKTYQSPQLYSYRAKIETKESPRDTRIPKLAMPIMPKGTSGDFNYVPSDQGETTPEVEVKPAQIVLSTLPDWCKNKPMQVPISVKAEKNITKVEVSADGELLLTVTPNALSYAETLSIPTEVFAQKARMTIMVRAYVGEVVSTIYSYLRIIPCEDATVQERRINVDAGALKVGSDWTIAGGAYSEKVIKSLKLAINSKPFDLNPSYIVGMDSTKAELQLKIVEEEWNTFGFKIGDTITVTLTATDGEGAEFEDTDTVTLIDDRIVPKDTIPVKEMRITIYDWKSHQFKTLVISDFSNQMNRVIGNDGRGIDLLVGWSKKEGRPVLMVKSGIGETGGIIIGNIQMTMTKNGVDVRSQMIRTHRESGASNMEALVSATPQQLSYKGQMLQDDGDLTQVARLDRLNSWIMPYFNTDIEAGLTADSIQVEAYEPEDHIVDPKTIAPGNNVCANITGFLYQRFDRTEGKFKLHYMHGSHRHFIQNGTMRVGVDVGYHLNPDGPALTVRGDMQEKMYISALGVLRQDTHTRAIYGQVYVGSEYFDKKDENGLYLGEPKNAAYWVDDIMNEGDDTEAPGITQKFGFLHVSAEASMAYCNTITPWKDAFGYELYDSIAPELTLTPSDSTISWQSLAKDGTDPKLVLLPFLAKMVDNKQVKDLIVYMDGVSIGTMNGSGTELNLSGNAKLEPMTQTETVPGETIGAADILFTVDTSGSMSNVINDVVTQLNALKQDFANSSVDIKMAYLGTNRSNQANYSQEFKSPANFTMNIGTDGGGFENMDYAQIDVRPETTTTLLGQLLPKRRAGVKLYNFVITDTYMGSSSSFGDKYGEHLLLTQVIDGNVNANVSISVAGSSSYKSRYDEMTQMTGGMNTLITDDFKVVFQNLLKKIEEEVVTYLDKTIVLEAIGRDAVGNIIRVTHTVTLRDQKYIN